MTTPTDYSNMSDDELKQYAVETIMGWRSTDMIGEGPSWISGYYPHIVIHMPFDNWIPTDPDSNQIERYIFPKLIEINEGLDIDVGFDSSGHNITIDSGLGKCLADNFNDNLDQINRTKLIACLTSWDKLMGDKE